MPDEDLRRAVSELVAKHRPLSQIKEELADRGFSLSEVEAVLSDERAKRISANNQELRINNRIILLREVLDRIGLGAVSPQFINILFYQVANSFFLLGLFSLFRNLTSLVTSVSYAKRGLLGNDLDGLGFGSSLSSEASFNDRSKSGHSLMVSNGFVSKAGIVYGFSFLLMALAIKIRSVVLFFIAGLLASLFFVLYSESYRELVNGLLTREKRFKALSKIGEYGVIITALSMILSGFIMDYFPASKISIISVGSFKIPIIGYLLSFEITAFSFIISGYVLNFIRGNRDSLNNHYSLKNFVRPLNNAFSSLVAFCSSFRGVVKDSLLNGGNKRLLLFAMALAGSFELLLTTYSGVFIYEAFKHQWLGGFLNIAVIYSIAIIISLGGPFFTRKVHRLIGLTPMLVFGTALLAIFPITLIVNPNLISIILAQSAAVIGASMVGVAQGLIADKIMGVDERKRFFDNLGSLLIIPFLLIGIAGAFIASSAGLVVVFQIIVAGLLFLVIPLYFWLVLREERSELR